MLELEDQFGKQILADAAAVAVLRRELKGLSGTAVETDRATARVQKSLKGVGDEADRTGGKVRRGAADIDRYSGRLELLLRIAAAIGPAVVPIAGVAVPAVAALTAGLGAAAGALGVTVLAVQGLGDAMKALDEYQLAPTTKNFQALRQELDAIGPTAAHFVRYLDSIEPELRSLQEAARRGVLPGWEAGIDAMLTRLPKVRRIIRDLAGEVGLLSAKAGGELAGADFRDFFNYLDTDAAPTLRAFAVATGNVIEGVTNMLVAFAPLNRDFAGGLVGLTDAFAEWSAGLGDNEGFQAFVEYLRSTGPQVLAFLGQFTLAFAAIVEAAAPVGQVLLPMLTALARTIELLAQSDLGTPLLAGLAAMSALRLATTAWSKISQTATATVVAGNARAAASYLTVTTATQRATMSARELAAMEATRNRAALVGAGKLGAGLAGLAIAATAAGDGLGLTNTASLALMGSMAGPVGAGLGAGVGVLLDMKASARNAEEALRAFNDALESGDPAQFSAALEQVNAQLERQTQNTILGTSFMGETVGQVANFLSPLSNVDKAMGQLTGSTDELRAATEKQGPTSDQAAAAMRRLAEGNYEVTTQAGATRTEIIGLVEAMEDQRASALAAFDAVTQYAQALIDARKQAEKSSIGIEITTDMTRKQRLAVIANRQALSELAGAWNNQSAAVRNNVDKYREARGQLIEVARDMGASAQQARNLANRLLEIPRQRVIDIQLQNIDQSSADLRRIKREVESIPRRWQTDYYVNQINTINRRFDPALDGLDRSAKGSADGSFVPKTGLPYADRHLYLLADGEGVTTNRRGETDRFRDVISGINAGLTRAQIRGMLADGGFTGDRGVGSAFGPTYLWHDLELSQRQYARAVHASEKGLRAEWTMRKKLLEQEVERAEKAVDLAKQHRDAVLDDIRSVRDSIAARFKSELFVDPQRASVSTQMPTSFESAEAAQAWYAQQQAAIDFVSQGQSPVDILRADLRRQREARRLYRELTDDRGPRLHGAALTYAQQNASNEQLQGLLNDPKMLRQYQQLYGAREQGARNLGQTAAMQRYGDKLEQLNQKYDASLTELRETKRELKTANHKLGQIEKNTKDGPGKTGDAVGDKVNGASAAGARGRVPTW